MIYLDEVKTIVNQAYSALAVLQFDISVKEPVSGDIALFNSTYTLSTKILACLQALEVMDFNHTAKQNREIEGIATTLKEITLKVNEKWA